MKKQISVLIPDGESPVLVYVINCFSKSKDVKLYVMSDKKNNYMRVSRYISKFIYFKKTGDIKDWIRNIDVQTEKFNIDLILPIYENAIRDLIMNKGHLRNKNKLCKLPNINNFNSACNKGLLHKHLKKHNIPSPNGIVLAHNESPDFNIIEFPVIAKPVEGYGGGKGIEVLKNEEEALEYFKENSFKCDVILQSYIKGYDICSNVLCENGEILACSIQKASVFENGELTYQIGFNFIDNDVLLDSSRNLMKSLNWSGVANIDWRFDESDNTFKVIEINTRYWYNTDASILAQVNFPYMNCLSSLNMKFEKPKVESIYYLNLKGLVKEIRKKPSVIFKRKFLLNNTPLIFVLKDPFPMIYKFIWRTKNKFFLRFNN